MQEGTLIDLTQVEASKEGYKNLYEQLEFGRFNSVKSGAAPTLYQEVVATEGQQDFMIPNGTYIMGDHSLQVFVNGQLMRVGSDNDYEETDSKSIRFTFGLTRDDIVVFRVNGGTSGPSLHEQYVAIEGDTVFILSSSYTVGNHSLLVFVNGAIQFLGVDYEETSAKKVTFLEPLEQDDLVIFRVEGLPSIEAKYQDSHTIRTFDSARRIIFEEIMGDTHISKEYLYDADGKPEKMITKEGGFTITKTYTWDDDLCTNIVTDVKEGI